MQVNDLPIPQSWADMMIDEVNELDFSLDPRPYFDRELLDAPCHDDAYRVNLAMTAMRYGYMPNSAGGVLLESPYEIKTHNFREFFLKMKGKLKRESFKPLLTEGKKVQRVSWCERLKGMSLLKRKFYACWIDEKWFYISSGQRETLTVSCIRNRTRRANLCSPSCSLS